MKYFHIQLPFVQYKSDEKTHRPTFNFAFRMVAVTPRLHFIKDCFFLKISPGHVRKQQEP